MAAAAPSGDWLAVPRAVAARSGDRFALRGAHAARRAAQSAPAVTSAAAPRAGLPDLYLVDPDLGVAQGAAQDVHDSVLLKKQGCIIALLAKPLEVADPYWKDGPLIPLFGRVASTSKDKVLYLFPSPHGAIPTRYFVFSPHGGVVQLPDVSPEILMPHSIGILTDGSDPRYDYQIAHLRLKPNPTTGLGQGFLVRWYYPSLSNTGPWTTECFDVKLPLDNCVKWQIHRVISAEGTGLLFPDLKQGILRLRLSKDVKFDFFDLPNGLPPIASNPWRSTCPEQFRSVGCCNGVVFFVNLHTSSGANHARYNTNIIEVGIWTLEIEYGRGDECTGKWIKKNEISTYNLDCRALWNNFKHRSLPPWPESVPSFPILSKNKSGILYLTVGGERNKQAWLLQIDMHTQTLKDVFEYRGYCKHMNPPFPSDLS